MTDSIDRILEAIDSGLQASDEVAWGHSDAMPDLCARCQRTAPAADGDLCDGCRAYLLEDSSEDPTRPQPLASVAVQGYVCDFGQLLLALAERDLAAMQAPRLPDHMEFRTGPDPDWVRQRLWDAMDNAMDGEPQPPSPRGQRGSWAIEDEVDWVAVDCRPPRGETSHTFWLDEWHAIDSSQANISEPTPRPEPYIADVLWGLAIDEYQAEPTARPSRAAAAPAERPHRPAERALIDQHRRSQRRTNRWGPPPGRL